MQFFSSSKDWKVSLVLRGWQAVVGDGTNARRFKKRWEKTRCEKCKVGESNA